MKNTPYTEIHQALGAKMAEFAGYNMPISYKGINEEHHAVRNSVGVFDVSHMGEFLVEGTGSLELIQKVTSNDASKLAIGQAQYSCLPNDKGGIVDDLLVYKRGEEKYLLVVNASNIEKDWNWINAHNTYGAKLQNVSDDYALLAVQGPKAAEALQSLTSIDLKSIAYYHFAEGNFADVSNIIISATGYTGAGGFELYIPKEHAVSVWHKIFEAGAAQNIVPVGLAARDTLRLEMGFALYGNDINDTTNPMEAGLGWITKFSKNFIGRNFAEEIKQQGASKKLVGFELIERGIPRHDYEIVNAAGEKIGIVTSGTQSPTLNKPIGMGYVAATESKIGNTIYISIRGKNIPAVVVKTPFIG